MSETTVFLAEIASIEIAKAILAETGQNPPQLKEKQYWYNTNGDLVQIVTLPDGHPEFGVVQVVEYRRAIIDLYARRDFDRFVYAPQILNKIA